MVEEQYRNMYNIAAYFYYKLREYGLSEVKRIYSYKEQEINIPQKIDLELITKASNLKNIKTPEDVIFCLHYLLSVDYLSSSNRMDYFLSTKSSLNTKYNNKVEIYRTYSCVYRGKNGYDEISCHFKNLMFYIPHKHQKITLKNYYCTDFIESLRIGVVPYPICEFERKEIDTKKIIFLERKKITKEDEIFLKTCNKLIRNKVNILLTPEIVGSSELDNEFVKLFLNIKPLLIVCPSYHRIGSKGKYYNQSTILSLEDNNMRKETITKNFEAKIGDYHEGICHGIERNIFIYHINGFGKIGV